MYFSGKEASSEGDGLEGGCFVERKEFFLRKENRARRHEVISHKKIDQDFLFS